MEFNSFPIFLSVFGVLPGRSFRAKTGRRPMSSRQAGLSHLTLWQSHVLTLFLHPTMFVPSSLPPFPPRLLFLIKLEPLLHPGDDFPLHSRRPGQAYGVAGRFLRLIKFPIFGQGHA